jgi:hypothetical protein
MKQIAYLSLAITLLVACTTPQVEMATAVRSPSVTSEPAPTSTASPMPAPSTETASRISAVIPVTIYGGPGSEYPHKGTLEAGANARLLETREGGWMNFECPNDVTGRCWILWDMNAIHSYEGPPMTLNIPDPASLKIESMNSTISPDGRWQALVTQTESVALDGESAFFFYTELIVTSLEDRRIWKPVSEWHVYGIGHEFAPMPFHWSQDGRYLYYTSLFDLHGACVSMNIGESLDRLDLMDGTVTALQSPFAFRLLSISPDETRIAYLGGQNITDFTEQQNVIVRELKTAHTGGNAGQESVLWQISLDIAWPTAVSEIAWSPDNRKVMVTATTIADDICSKASSTTWELDIATGELVEVSSTIFPTPTP